jgi:hypothetical protein
MVDRTRQWRHRLKVERLVKVMVWHVEAKDEPMVTDLTLRYPDLRTMVNP